MSISSAWPERKSGTLTMRCMARTVTLLTALLVPACSSPDAGAAPYDILIRGGRVIDGTGGAWFYADVGVRDGRIAAVGDLGDAAAAEVVDAIGPGGDAWIHRHAHALGVRAATGRARDEQDPPRRDDGGQGRGRLDGAAEAGRAGWPLRRRVRLDNLTRLLRAPTVLGDLGQRHVLRGLGPASQLRDGRRGPAQADGGGDGGDEAASRPGDGGRCRRARKPSRDDGPGAVRARERALEGEVGHPGAGRAGEGGRALRRHLRLPHEGPGPVHRGVHRGSRDHRRAGGGPRRDLPT